MAERLARHDAAFLAGRFDLHVHTTNSDGIWTPTEIVRLAKQCGLAGLAVTDHDTLDGWAEATAAAEAEGLFVLCGVEMSTEVDTPAAEFPYEVHMLGYFPAGADGNISALAERLEELQKSRWTRALKMLDKLEELGMPLSTGFLADYQASGSLGRGVIARKLVEAGYVQDKEEVFQRWLDPGRPAYVPRQRITPQEAIGLIHAAGGVAVMAHPVQAGHDEIVPELAAAGLDGLECRHPDQPAGALQEHYLRLAAELRLPVSGGSDCHDGGLGDFTASGAELLRLLKID